MPEFRVWDLSLSRIHAPDPTRADEAIWSAPFAKNNANRDLSPGRVKVPPGTGPPNHAAVVCRQRSRPRSFRPLLFYSIQLFRLMICAPQPSWRGRS